MPQVAITGLLAPIAELVRQAPTNTLVRAYVAAAREFCQETRWHRKEILGPTVVDQKRYNLGSDTFEEVFGIAAMSLNTGEASWKPVTEGNVGNQDPNAGSDLPTLYEYVPHGQFSLYPTPNGVYDVKVTAVIQPKTGVTTIDSVLLTNWDETIRHGALYRLLRIKGQPWTDPAESGVQNGLFMKGVYKAQADVAAGFNAGAASTSALGPPNGRLRGRVQPI